MIVIPGPASQKLGQRVGELLKIGVVPVEFKRFPDGESYLRFEDNLEGEDVVIIQTTGPPQNENLIQLFLMADNAKDLGARTVTAVIPYFAYARQDKRFRSGEVFSVKTVMRVLEGCGVDRIITVNTHNPEILRAFTVPVMDLSAIGLIAEHFKNLGFDGAFSLSLGKKAFDIAKQASSVLKGEYGSVQTQRDRLNGRVTIGRKSLPVKDRDLVIFDDIISSGGTMVEAVKWVREQGARRVYAACVHPLLIGDAEKRILKSGAEGIVGTDCVPSHLSVVSVAPLIAASLARGF